MKRSPIFCYALMCILMIPAGRTNCVFAGIDSTAFVSNPILARPTDKSITINVVPKKAYQIYFEYGTSSMIYTNTTETKNSAANIPISFVINNLIPNTRYYYRIRYQGTGSSTFIIGEEHSFTTQRAKGSKFRFGMQADSHLYDKKGIPVMMNVTMQNQNSDSLDFVLDLGDTFGDDHTPTTTTQADMNQLHLDFLPYIGQVCHSAPFFFCLGNHEGERGYYLLQTPPNNIGVYGTLARNYYYSNPIPDGFYSGNTNAEQFGMDLPQNYYAWEWGDALFVVLDVYRNTISSAKPGSWDWTLGATQYNWLSETLKGSKAKFKFVFAHHVRGEGRGAALLAKNFEWGGYDEGGTYTFTGKRPGWELPIHQLMIQNGVNVFFQGHDHLFAKEDLDGLVYQEVPMPSDSSYMIGMLANADAYTANQINGTGYIRVSVCEDSATVDYVKSYLPKDTSETQRNREVAFTYSVKPSSTPVQSEVNLSKEFRLEQNYPNPFNPSTEIKFSIAEAGHATLRVMDVLGREIATLFDGYKQQGEYVYNFSSKCSHGGNLAVQIPSGIYFYQLRVNSSVFTKKMILMK